MRAVNQHAEQEAHSTLKSPLLFGVLQDLEPDTRIEIMDLAPANAALLDYFSQFHCKLHLPGCRDELLGLGSHGNENEEDEVEPPLSHKLQSLMPLHDSDRSVLNLLLLWDLTNYLEQSVLTALIEHLSPYISEHTILHTYIHTRQTMPEQPGDYHLSPQHHVTFDLSTQWTAPSPMYHQALLNKVFSPFRVSRGMLLANGFQEYILRTA